MIGIDISDRSIKIVQLSNGAERRLLTNCWLLIPAGIMEHGVVQNIKVMQKAIEQAWAACKPRLDLNDSVVASIPEAQSFLRVIEIPTMQADEIGEAVQWEVAQHIPFGLENVYLDWQPLSSKGHAAAAGHQEVLVGAAQKKVVDPLFTALDGLDLDVAALELESQALVRSLVSGELHDRQGILIVDVGGSVTNMIIHDHGAMRFSASIAKGMQYVERLLPAEMAGVFDSELQDMSKEQITQLMELARPAIEEIVIEIKGVVEFYNGIDAQHVVKEVVLAGGGSNMPDLGAIFGRHFENVHVQRGNPWANILSGQKSPQLPMSIADSARYATALGLVLREVIR